MRNGAIYEEMAKEVSMEDLDKTIEAGLMDVPKVSRKLTGTLLDIASKKMREALAHNDTFRIANKMKAKKNNPSTGAKRSVLTKLLTMSALTGAKAQETYS